MVPAFRGVGGAVIQFDFFGGGGGRVVLLRGVCAVGSEAGCRAILILVVGRGGRGGLGWWVEGACGGEGGGEDPFGEVGFKGDGIAVGSCALFFAEHKEFGGEFGDRVHFVHGACDYSAVGLALLEGLQGCEALLGRHGQSLDDLAHCLFVVCGVAGFEVGHFVHFPVATLAEEEEGCRHCEEEDYHYYRNDERGGEGGRLLGQHGRGEEEEHGDGGG